MGILTKIRQGTDGQKRFFSLAIAIILTIIIVIGWFSLTKDPATNEQAKEEQNKLSSFSPLEIIKDEFSRVFTDFGEKIGELESGSTTPNLEITNEQEVQIEIVSEETKVDEQVIN